jgi:hypothetical protein
MPTTPHSGRMEAVPGIISGAARNSSCNGPDGDRLQHSKFVRLLDDKDARSVDKEHLSKT